MGQVLLKIIIINVWKTRYLEIIIENQTKEIITIQNYI